MADIVDPKTRSRMMGGIKGKNTVPEMTIRRGLHGAGFRFRLHARDLPGRPDLVFRSRKAVVFVHGCFWHRHPGCRYATTPATRPDFWAAKFDGNVVRDQRNVADLLAAGWRIGVVWECALRDRAQNTIDRLADWLRSDQPRLDLE